MENRKLTRKEQAIITQDKIFKSAIDLMEKKGFDNMTISDIIKHADVSVGTFYHYFKSKEDVFFELYRNADQYFKEIALLDIEISSASSAEKTVLFFIHYAKFNINNGLENVSQLYSTKNKLFIGKDRYMIQLLKQLIENGQQNSELRTDISSDAIVDQLFITGRGVVFDWCLHDGKYDLEQKMRTIFENYIRIFLK